MVILLKIYPKKNQHNFIDNYYFYHKIIFGSHVVLCDLMNNAFIVKAKGVTHEKCNSLQKCLHS